MAPKGFVEHQERRLGRSLTPVELAAVLKARAACTSGKRDTVKAMWIALRAEMPTR